MSLGKGKPIASLFGANAWANIVYLISFTAMGLVFDAVEFGAFRVAQVYITIGVSLGMIGLNTALTHQLPLLDDIQQRNMIGLAATVVFFSAILVGIGVYLLLPTALMSEFSIFGVIYFLSYPLAVAGGGFCNLGLSIFQARGNWLEYTKLQSQWKTLVFLFALVGSLMQEAKIAIVLMGLSYILIFYLNASLRSLFEVCNFSTFNFVGLGKALASSGIWPFASICASAIYANIEFLYVRSDEINNGMAGAYALASIIYIGGAAFFMPLQTYVGNLVVNKNSTIKRLLWLQFLCAIAVGITSVLAYASSFALNIYFPTKFDDGFLEFSVLVCIKLSLWGGYAVIGSVLNFINRGFESFLLSACCLALMFFVSISTDLITSLYRVLQLQIISNLFLFVGCFYILTMDFRGQSKIAPLYFKD